MTDFSHFKLTSSSELFEYKEIFAQDSKILNDTWLWLINRPPGSIYDITKLQEAKREIFIKIVCCFIADKHEWLHFNETFTELKCDLIPHEFGEIPLFKNQIKKRLMENILMNDNHLIESPTGKTIRVGKVTEGHLNIMTSFNPLESGMYLSLKKFSGVGSISGMYAYDDGSGGISITINEDFRFNTFLEQLTELLMSIDEIHEMI